MFAAAKKQFFEAHVGNTFSVGKDSKKKKKF